MTNSIWLSAACGAAVGLAVLVAGERLATAVGVDGRLLPLVALLAPGTLFVTLAGSILVSEERFGAVNGWQVANASLALIALAICALTRQGVEAFLLGTTMAALTTACGMAYALCRGRTLAWRFDRVLFASGIGFALRAYVAVLAGFLLQRSGATALMLAGDPAQLGVFSIASQIFDVMIILPTTVALVLFPGLVKQQGSGWNATWAALRVVLVLMAMAAAAVILTGRWLIPTVFGAAFAPSFAPMLALLPSVLAISVVSVLSQYLVSRRFPLGLVGLWLVGCAIAEIAALPAVRRWGGIGAASAQSLGSLFVLGGIALMTYKKVYTESRGHDGG
jgi:O-antigen/teichoic acid export membrane protein